MPSRCALASLCISEDRGRARENERIFTFNRIEAGYAKSPLFSLTYGRDGLRAMYSHTTAPPPPASCVILFFCPFLYFNEFNAQWGRNKRLAKQLIIYASIFISCVLLAKFSSRRIKMCRNWQSI